MTPASARPLKPALASASTSTRGRRAARPFLGMLDSVIVESPVEFVFEGAVTRGEANAVWTWFLQDIAADLIDPDVRDDDPMAQQALDALMPDLMTRARAALTAAVKSAEAERRLKSQLGGDEVFARVPIVLNALKCRHLLDKAQAFGRATNAMTDDAALTMALQSMPLNDQAVASLLMMAAIGQVANPSRLITAVIKLSGGATEASIQRAGFTPLVDAILAHAQNQTPALRQSGPFADIDLTCRAVDRFHRLVRSLNAYVELGRSSRWTTIIAALTKTVSERIEPHLRDVTMDVNRALRRREGTDRLDSDQLLSALNGVFVLATVRDARDSLALNALFDQTWMQVGQALEIHVQRNLEVLKQNPTDPITVARFDAAIKMAELRFSPDYAEVLRRAREAAQKTA